MATIQSEIASELRRQLLEGAYPKGSKLPSERQLAEQYDVSRNVVREVLSGLADRNLITIEPGRGAFVTEPSAVDASLAMDRVSRDQGATPEHLMQARLVLETEAAEMACRNSSPTELDRLSVLAKAVDTALLTDRAQFDLAFHLGVARLARSPIIESLLISIAPMTAELMLRSLSDPGVSREGLPLHHDLTRALLEGDATRARTAVEEHLRIAERSYGPDYVRPLEDLARESVERHASLVGRSDLSDQIDGIVSRALTLAAIRDEEAVERSEAEDR